MIFKKMAKYPIAICIVLLIFIVTILLAMGLNPFAPSPEKTDSEILSEPEVTNIALIINDECSELKTNLLKQSLDSISEDFSKTYDMFYVKDYDNSYRKTIEAATSKGAGLVICPDSSFEEIVYELQNTYVSTTFLIVDGVPHNTDNSDSTVNFNVIPLLHDISDAGFLAGYAAVYSGHTKVAFIGLADDSASAHYCYGFLQGADYAASQQNTKNVNVTYTYVEEENAKAAAEEFYRNDYDMLVVSNNAIIDQALEVAHDQNQKIIICGDDYEPDYPECIIASTDKNTYISIYDCLQKFYNNVITAGTVQSYSTSNQAITLDFKEEDFVRFDANIYQSIYMKLSDDDIQVVSDTTVPIEDLELTTIKPVFKDK